MALTLSPPPTSTYIIQITHQHPAVAFPNRNTTTTSTSPLNLFNNRNFLPPIHLHRSSSPSASNSSRCRAVSPGRPPSPEFEPPNGNDPSPSEGLTATFARLQDTVQIFFAVLFWMSLFFWSSVWDGSNNDRPGKGPRFRR